MLGQGLESINSSQIVKMAMPRHLLDKWRRYFVRLCLRIIMSKSLLQMLRKLYVFIYVCNVQYYWTPRAKRAGSYQTFTTFNRCTKKCHENHRFWEASKASPKKRLPLSRAKREKFPSLHTPNWCTQKCHRKPPVLRGEHSEPWKATLSLSSEAREVSLTTYP